MSKLKKIIVGLLMVAIVLPLSACSSSDKSADSAKTVKLAYMEWDDSVSSTNVVAEVLREMGYTVEMTPLDNAIVWKSVADRQADAMVSAWLPLTHGPQYDTYKNKIDLIGPSLSGAQSGLVVPSYMTDVNSVTDLVNQANKTITGIEPGAGIMTSAENALKQYSNLKDWKLMPSSTGAMTATLDKAYKNKDQIVITGWEPHWMFTKYDLKFLEDPEKLISSPETINTVARQGLKEDKPEVYKVLQNFKWDMKDIGEVMLQMSNGKKADQAAKEWISQNQDKVNSWKNS
ncbi:glycine betaine ABC transporter substrate-binding protein [Holzapfeliella sp. He02]|uniref:Glycine betaine ABC transporter substrate-binding protein n=1 Tax=Holzapfeliella saturejae TaxID=3082953 RepID=A0ABU8SEX7_9LACO